MSLCFFVIVTHKTLEYMSRLIHIFEYFDMPFYTTSLEKPKIVFWYIYMFLNLVFKNMHSIFCGAIFCQMSLCFFSSELFLISHSLFSASWYLLLLCGGANGWQK
jgi:hypothetical protein